ncbi:MAG: Outer membrane and periplasm component of type IV secretion of T-DNA complex, has secretin-like domain, VirB9, partial [uncultured Sphingomonas sp.]
EESGTPARPAAVRRARPSGRGCRHAGADGAVQARDGGALRRQARLPERDPLRSRRADRECRGGRQRIVAGHAQQARRPPVREAAGGRRAQQPDGGDRQAHLPVRPGSRARCAARLCAQLRVSGLSRAGFGPAAARARSGQHEPGAECAAARALAAAALRLDRARRQGAAARARVRRRAVDLPELAGEGPPAGGPGARARWHGKPVQLPDGEGLHHRRRRRAAADPAPRQAQRNDHRGTAARSPGPHRQHGEPRWTPL